jgi:hypothetical protein
MRQNQRSHVSSRAQAGSSESSRRATVALRAIELFCNGGEKAHIIATRSNEQTRLLMELVIGNNLTQEGHALDVAVPAQNVT